MEQFKKKINGIDFEFHGFFEGPEEVCTVRTDDQQFKMVAGEDGWQIFQQVPAWVKELEGALSDAIDEAYS